MDFIRSASTADKHIDSALRSIQQALHTNPALILFFASTSYNFEQLTAQFTLLYPKAQVVGVTTTGEIGPKGFQEHSLSVQSYSQEFGKISTVLMKDIEKYPIFDRAHLVTQAQQIGIRTESKSIAKEGLAYVFPVGLKAGEEKMLSVVNSIFTTDGFPIFGGTAGDDAKFEMTYISVNGEISSTGGAVIFMKPTMDFHIFKENIFESTGKKMQITRADAEKRIVYEINNKPAAQVYAQMLGISVKELQNHFSRHPIGRKFNNDFYIASPFQVLNGKEIEFYCQVYEGAFVEILKPKHPETEMQKTIEQMEQYFTTIYGVLGCNCILRKLQFTQERLFNNLNKHLQQLPNLSGFSSYGEQFNKSQLNQTLLLIGFGKKR